MNKQIMNRQRDRVVNQQPQKPEIPGDYMCAGECTQPVPSRPSLPASKPIPTVTMGFRDYGQSNIGFWAIIGTASVLYYLVGKRIIG